MYILTFRLLRPDGELRYILDQGLVRRDAQGAVLAVYGVCLDITEQRMTQAVLEREVWERTTELRALNEELELFCYSVSHDLRAPLRHIVGYAELLKQEAPAAAGTPSLLKIEDSARRMGVLIDELLRFAHTTRHELRREMVDMNETVSRIRDRYMTSDPEANKHVVWRVATMPGAWGDRSLLTQVWQNLIDNALKYSHRSRPAIIEIGCRQRARYQLFFIRDNGIGFNMRNLGQVFGVFQRLHSAEDFEGHGLGLANVLRLVLRHGGRCGARGTPGRGALFYFTLPVAPAPGEIKIEKEMDGRSFADLWSPVFEARMAAEST
jgi:light-regulated signal transduction histidine kinase (bacteriophytochrome)